MNYRHAYHAGNFADVVKHVALTAVLLHLRRKQKPFAVFDTHAGRGLYDLASMEAGKTGEAASGIDRLAPLPAGTDALGTYLGIVRGAGGTTYPGSPLIAAHLLRPQDRLVAIEKHPEEFAVLRAALSPFAKARAMEGDGYARLIALLPPPERRGLVIVDPPFEDDDEFARMSACFAKAHERFATGHYLFWYPVKSRQAVDAFCAELLTTGAQSLLRVEIARTSPEETDKLAATGIAMVNPPYLFDVEMETALKTLAPLLGAGGKDARTSLALLRHA